MLIKKSELGRGTANIHVYTMLKLCNTASTFTVSGTPIHEATEVFMCAETHKSYAVRSGDYQLYLLFSPSMPTFAMRQVLATCTYTEHIQLFNMLPLKQGWCCSI